MFLYQREARVKTSVIAIVATLLMGTLAHAQGNTLSLVLDVDHDGSAVAVEKLELASPMREPLHWRMPTAVTTPLGVRRLLFLQVLEISDGRGNKIDVRTREYGDKLDVMIPVQSLADNAVRITYEIRNAARFRDEQAELFWHVGQAWSESFAGASVNLTLPSDAAGQVRAQLYEGGRASARPLSLQGATAALEIAGPQAGLSGPVLDLVFAPGVLQPPPLARRCGWFLRANPIVLLPGVLLLAMAAFRRYQTRGQSPAALLVPRYEAPEDMPPVEAGYFIDGSLDHRDLAAMLLDLARRGFIRIEAGTPDEEVPYPAPDFVLRLLKPMDQWKGAYPYEHVMLFHTFYGGQWTKLSSLSLRFFSVVPSIERMVREALQSRQLYLSPRRIAAQRVGAVLVLAAVLGLAQAAGWFAVAQSWLFGGVVVVSFMLITLLFTRGVNHRTAKGARVFAELRGFEMFLNSVEADRMERVTPDLFERFLPYAIALGIEHRWGAAFSTISSGPPLWWDAKSGGIPDFVHLVTSSAHPPRRGPQPMAVEAQSPSA